MAKHKRKSLRQLARIYEEKYGHIPKDIDDMRSFIFSNMKWNNTTFLKYQEKSIMIDSIEKDKIEYTLFEIPYPSNRPRKGKNNIFYVPNAKAKKTYAERALEYINKFAIADVQLVLNMYIPMKKDLPLEEQMLAEEKKIRPLSKPDNDNVYKTYSDMIIEFLILDDSNINSIVVDKYYSFKPRVEVKIVYNKSFTSKKLEKMIKGRKSYKKLLKLGVIKNEDIDRKKEN